MPLYLCLDVSSLKDLFKLMGESLYLIVHEKLEMKCWQNDVSTKPRDIVPGCKNVFSIYWPCKHGLCAIILIMRFSAIFLLFVFTCLRLGAQDVVLDVDDPQYEGGYQDLFEEGLPPDLEGHQVDMRSKFGFRSFENAHLNDALFQIRQNIPMTIVSRIDDSVRISGDFAVVEWGALIEEAAERHSLSVSIDPSGKILLIEGKADPEAPVDLVSVHPSSGAPIDWSRSRLLSALRKHEFRLRPTDVQRLSSDYTPFVFRSSSAKSSSEGE